MGIQIKSIVKSFGKFEALRGIDLNIEQGELVALLGPSGCGKTTLLRVIAGLETPDTGSILFSNEDRTYDCVRDRNVGFVFQHYALFRHMTVRENIAFGLKVKPKKQRLPKDEIEKKVMDLLRLVQLDFARNHYPSQLSGGQRQRVALARALAIEPKIMLLDEPFGALDAVVRRELRRWLRRLHAELELTSIFVTHDQEEALEVADRIVVMNHGIIEQMGTPEDVYENPANPFVFHFLGNVNIFYGRNKKQIPNVSDSAFEPVDSITSPSDLTLGYARPHEIEILTENINGNLPESQIISIVPLGAIVRIELIQKLSHNPIDVELTKATFNALKLEVGQTVYLRIKKLKVFTN